MRKLASYFRTIDVNDGSKRVTLTDDRPEWLYEAVREAHCSDFPNDWIYDECRAACEFIDSELDGYQCGVDGIHYHADMRVDVYTRELFQWAADMCLTATFAQAKSDLNDMGERPADMVKQISALQFCAIRRIAETMLAAYKVAKEDEC